MGVDIHLHIIKDQKVIAQDIFDGRNSEWFDNLQGRGNDSGYDRLPTEYGFPDEAPNFIKEDAKKGGYYGFHYIIAGEFCEWFNKYHPDLQAGWISTFDKWQLERKKIIPEEFYYILPNDANDKDMIFCEWQNEYDCSLWLYNYLLEHEVYADAVIVYYFDC